MPTAELAALGTAVCWALCGLCFALAGRRSDPISVNLLRIVLGFAVLSALHALSHGGQWWPTAANDSQLVWLLASGFVGLALGDLCLFHCLVHLGPRIGSLLMALSPAMTAVLAKFVLGERLDTIALLGIAVVSAGVIAVVLDRSDRASWTSPRGAGASRVWPLATGVLAALGQAAGLVLAKCGMMGGTTASIDVASVDPLSATVVRMAAGAVGTAAFALLFGVRSGIRRTLRDAVARRAMLLGTLTGPVLGVWLSLIAIERGETGVAATLMSITPILMLPIGRWAYGSRPGKIAVFGTCVAVFGTVLLIVR